MRKSRKFDAWRENSWTATCTDAREKGITPSRTGPKEASLYKVGNPSIGATEYPEKQLTGDEKISRTSRIIRFLYSIRLVAKIEG